MRSKLIRLLRERQFVSARDAAEFLHVSQVVHGREYDFIGCCSKCIKRD